MLQPGDHVVDVVDDCLHDLLPADDAAYVRTHCHNCAICRLAMDEARQRHALLRVIPLSEPSERLIQQTFAGVTRRAARRKHVRRLAWRTFSLAMAAAILIVASIHIYYANLSASPYDLKVLTQSMLRADTEASLRCFVVRNDSGKPVGDVPIAIDLLDSRGQVSVRLADFKTNQDGTGQPRFKLPDWKDGDYMLRVTASPGGGDEIATQTLKLQRSWKLMLSTDKPVYQPGQTIHLRALALRQPDLHAVAGQNAVFTLTDPKGNVLFKHHEVTSRFGIASADCELAEEIIQGPYIIRCAIGETISQCTVEIKKYVLPKFKVEAELDKTFYQPGDKLHLAVHAGYFFGKPVAGGSVEVVSRDGAESHTTTTFTNDQGEAVCDLLVPRELIGHEQDSGDARIWLDVTVRDTAGQTQQRTISRVVTNKPLRIELIPEASQLAQGVTNRIYVLTTYADGQPATARVSVSGLETELHTSDLGVCSFELTPKTEQINLAVSAADDAGLRASRDITLKCGAADGSFIVRADKAVYSGGDSLKLHVFGGGSEPIFVDLVKDHQTLLTESVEMNGHQGELTIDLPPDLSGTLELNAYRFGPEGLAVRQNRVLYVRPAQQLHLNVATDRPEYRPGETAAVSLLLSDAAGHPTPGAISLAAVDEAVFSVTDSAPGMEGTFFTLEQELLKPIYSIYGWDPGHLSTNEPQKANELEQALFARASAEMPDAAPSPAAAAIQKAVANGDMDPSILEVLKRPDVGQLLDAASIDEPYRSMIRASADASALVETTYPGKVERVAVQRESGIEAAQGAWVMLAIVAGIAGVVWIYQFAGLRPLLTLGLVLLCGSCLISIMLPSLNRARETADRVKCASNLRQIGQAMMMANDEVSGGTALPSPLPSQSAPRVREWFPETLLWRPELITDENGRAKLNVDLADSITTWRLSASAVTTDGRLGANQSSVRVFQPFFVDIDLPVALTRGDEISVPVALYNYAQEAQTIDVKLEPGDGWFESLDEPDKRVDLKVGEVRSTSFRLRVKKVGLHKLHVTALSNGVSDAVRRNIQVLPDGRPVEQLVNGSLQQPLTTDLSLPANIVEGSAKLFVKLYPSSFSQLVEGLDGIFQMPYGCFEQTSSTTYPNVLALSYLRKTGKSVPDVEAKARQYIQLGYQRLVSFEVEGGGFDWFGHPAANTVLTAYGLMEFQDMAAVQDVDPQLIERTRQWLLARRQSDGSWPADPNMLQDGLAQSVMRGDDVNLATTAYVAWAVFGGEHGSADASATRQYLHRFDPMEIRDPYALSVLANAELALDPTGNDAAGALDRLMSLKQTSTDGKLSWWAQPFGSRTAFYGSGQSGSIETTAMAAQAMIRAGRDPATIRAALAWLIEQKDAQGTWNSTQATVLALKALLAGTGKPLGNDVARRFHLTLGDVDRQISVDADQSEVLQQIDLSGQLHQGTNRLSLEDQTGTACGYQICFRYNLPAAEQDATTTGPLSISLTYDKADLKVGGNLTVSATVTNNTADTAPMVMLDLPIPAGFKPAAEDFDKLVERGSIAKYELTPRTVIVYMRSLGANSNFALTYRFTATMPVRILVPPARAYEYYDPAKQGFSHPSSLFVGPA